VCRRTGRFRRKSATIIFDAKAAICKIIEQTGYFPVDLGALDVGGPLASLPFGSLAAANFIRI
jgi:8-hydroxy-5-deazaflavin:NADPH oxidoreductase